MDRFWGLVDAVEALVHRTLSSRKAMAAITGVVTGLVEHNLQLVGGSVAAYVLGEAYVDAKGAQQR